MRILLLIFLFISYTGSTQKLKPISTYLANKKVSKEAKKFYKNLPAYKKDPQKYYADPNIEMTMASIMDSVYADNISLRPFYLYLVNRNLDLIDGALALMSYMKQYEILETEPRIFFQYMLDNQGEKTRYFSKWASSMSVFSDQYCEGIMNTEQPRCMQDFRKAVLKGLPANNTKLLALAGDFMKLMNVQGLVPE